MKQIQTLSRMSDWHWELNSIQHASTLFEKRLSSLRVTTLPASRQPEVAGLLRQVQEHQQELAVIQTRIEEYSLRLLREGKNSNRQQELDELQDLLENWITKEINAFTKVKNQYFSLIRNMLFPDTGYTASSN
ncbi:MAG TPA: hypothetical protein PKE63_13295 [Lacibacter sp.]|nr:hypothetical protein [Lacibacter sp.]HMO89347.1 hypothetical protein [Lacibacter sp.]HMP88249.1 hypothetical protein [Lacibacter sp.]